MERKSITNYSSITRIPSSITTCVPSPHTDTRIHAVNFSAETIARAPVPAVLPRGQTHTRRSGSSRSLGGGALQSKAKVTHGGRGAWPAAGCACQDSGRCGQRPYTHTKRTQGERLFPVSLLLWLLFAFAKIWSHVLLGWWFSNYDLLIDKIFLKWMPRIGRTSMFLYSSCFCK